MRLIQPAPATARPRQGPRSVHTQQLADCRAIHRCTATASQSVEDNTAPSGPVQHASQDSTALHFRGRRAALLALGVSPLLLAASASPAGATSSETAVQAASEASNALQQDSQSASSSTQADSTQDVNAGSEASQQQQQDQEQQQQQDDDSPSALLEDEEEDSSSSSSSSDEEGDSDSSSDEEPGELFASAGDNNNAAGGSGSSDGNDGSSSNSSSAPGPDTPSVRQASNTNTNSSSSSSSISRTSMASNLSVPSYVQILQDSRRSSWPKLAQKIQSRDWIALSQLLVQPPFDAVRQACFYIPWALLQCDDFTAAVAARKAYLEYIDHVHALAAIALKAADGMSGADVQVQQAFTLMNASLDAFLSAVPTKYQRYRI